MTTLPLLIIIPHGGCLVPSELSGFEAVDEFDIFLESDTCANQIFGLREEAHVIDTDISRLFVDMDRPYTALPPATGDGVIRVTTHSQRQVFHEGTFPDHLAISNILRRYYFPFHEAIEKTRDAGNIRMILECHTMPAVEPAEHGSHGRPNPLFSLESLVKGDSEESTCPVKLLDEFKNCILSQFSREEETITDRMEINARVRNGYLLKKYGTESTPMVRFSISRSLFLNERYWNPSTLEVDTDRLREIRTGLGKALKRFCTAAGML